MAGMEEERWCIPVFLGSSKTYIYIFICKNTIVRKVVRIKNSQTQRTDIIKIMHWLMTHSIRHCPPFIRTSPDHYHSLDHKAS